MKIIRYPNNLQNSLAQLHYPKNEINEVQSLTTTGRVGNKQFTCATCGKAKSSIIGFIFFNIDGMPKPFCSGITNPCFFLH